MEILSNKDGMPLMAVGKKVVAFTTGSKAVDPVDKMPNEKPKLTFMVGSQEFVNWGGSNRYPDKADETIRSCGVLQTALGFKARTCFGQGVLPYRSDGFDENGERVLRPVKDLDLLNYLSGYTFRSYMESALRDLFKFGNAFPVFYFNRDGSKIVRISAVNARHCRISKNKKKLVVYPDFQYGQPITSVGDYRVLDMLDEDDPFLDFESRRVTGKLGTKPLAFPRLKNYFSNNDYYAAPDWEAALRSGWIDIAKQVPVFLKHAYENAMSLMWHIQIPASWYDWKFPKEKYGANADGEAARQRDIEAFWDELEKELCGQENANKAIFSDYGSDGFGHSEDKWVIERLKNEIDAKERLTTSAAANNEILFAVLINPATLGAGMPGGAYAGQAGSGSDIRESYLVSIVSNYVEKQQVLDPVLLALRYNYPELGDIVLRYKETILTTLNTGNSVGETEN